MSRTPFTPAQEDAIYSRGENLLVAAGAGSGKTTVLVERILSRLREGGDISHLLALTFTNAAAGDMRRKLDQELARLLREDPDQPHLARAAALLPQAGVCTLHSFCLDLLRKYYYCLDLTPGFRVASSQELAALSQEVLDDLLEEKYDDPASGLPELADAYGGNRDDRDVAEIIRKLYLFSLSRPDPGAWLEGCLQAYEPRERLEDYPFGPEIRQELSQTLGQAAALLSRAARRDVPALWQDQVMGEREAILAAANCPSLDQALAYVADISFSTLAYLPKAERAAADPEELDAFRHRRDGAKKLVRKVQDRLAARSPKEHQADLALLREPLAALVGLVREFAQRLGAEKRRRLLVDFSDMEHLTLELLQQEQVAADLSAAFDEVLVDEYQDINEVQEAIIKQLAPASNLFAVGDVKQSIYRFRLAEPGLFLDKYHSYAQGGAGRRIDLNRNYRSDQQLLAGINFVFSQLMVASVAELDYDAAAALYPGRLEPGARPEFRLIRADGAEKGVSLLTLEGRSIARRVEELRREGFAYKDMAILLRAVKGRQDLLAAALAERGIPTRRENQATGEDSPELLLVLSLLKIIDNPRQDIPLAAVLRSPLFSFTADQLVAVRLNHSQGDLYQALLAAATGQDQLAAVSRDFLARLEEWRRMGREQRVSELLLHIYHQGRLLRIAGALPNGAQRQEELRALLEQAYAYENASYAGLFRFIRLVEEGQDQEGRPGVNRGPEDAVRILTIHKSKGLEFPVVFVAGLAGPFNVAEQRGDIIWERRLGLGAKVADRTLRQKYPSLSHEAVSHCLHRQALAEEMRVLYVAMTRARQRLILTAAERDIAGLASHWVETLTPPPWLPFDVLATAQRPLDWLGPALLRSGGDNALASLAQRPPAPLEGGELWRIAVEDPLPAAQPPSLDSLAGEEIDGELAQEVARALDYSYPFRRWCAYPAKWSVSALARLHAVAEEEDCPGQAPGCEIDAGELDAGEPEPADREELAARQDLAQRRGTALHRALSLLELGFDNEEQLEQRLADLRNRGLLTPEEAALVELKPLAAFFATPQGQALNRASWVRRETPFTYLQEEEGEYILVQGVIDAAYWTDQGWVLLDYKTGGRGLGVDQLREKYGLQLAAYGQAIQRLWDGPLAASWLCLLDQGRNISM